jgi:hypothetical protein
MLLKLKHVKTLIHAIQASAVQTDPLHGDKMLPPLPRHLFNQELAPLNPPWPTGTIPQPGLSQTALLQYQPIQSIRCAISTIQEPPAEFTSRESQQLSSLSLPPHSIDYLLSIKHI